MAEERHLHRGGATAPAAAAASPSEEVTFF
jgi:hypothetical protein